MLRGVLPKRGGILWTVCLLFCVGRNFGQETKEGMFCWTTVPCEDILNHPASIGCHPPTHPFLNHNGAVSLKSWTNERGWNDGTIQLVQCERDEICFSETDGETFGAGGCINRAKNPIIQKSLGGECTDRWGNPADCEQHGCKNIDGISIAWCDLSPAHACNLGAPRTCEPEKPTVSGVVCAQPLCSGMMCGGMQSISGDRWSEADGRSGNVEIVECADDEVCYTLSGPGAPDQWGSMSTSGFVYGGCVSIHDMVTSSSGWSEAVATSEIGSEAVATGELNGCVSDNAGGISFAWCDGHDGICNLGVPETCTTKPVLCQVNAPGYEKDGVPIHNWVNGGIQGIEKMTLLQACPKIDGVQSICQNVVFEDKKLGDALPRFEDERRNGWERERNLFVMGTCASKQNPTIVAADQGNNGCVDIGGSSVSWCDPLNNDNVFMLACNQGHPQQCLKPRVVTEGGPGQCDVVPMSKEECDEVARATGVVVAKKPVKIVSKKKLPKGCFIRVNLKRPQRSRILFNTEGKTDSGCGRKRACVCGAVPTRTPNGDDLSRQ